MIVTIDGPAGAGKSSVARALAKALELEPLELMVVRSRSNNLGQLVNAVVWASALVLIGIVFKDDPASNNAAVDVVFPAALISIFLVPWLTRRSRKWFSA